MEEKRLGGWSEEQENYEEHVADLYLVGLGLSWDYLLGKKILDIGARRGEFAKVAQRKGVNIVSLDNMKAPIWSEQRKAVFKESGFVAGDATQLPFADNTFDLILSHAAPPTVFAGEAGGKNAVEMTLQEAKRILKEGGEFRFGPAMILSVETKERDAENKSIEEKVHLAVDASYKLLKSIDPKITFEENNLSPGEFGANEDYFYSHKHYFSLKKGSEVERAT